MSENAGGEVIDMGLGTSCPVRLSRGPGRLDVRFLGASPSRPVYRTASVVFAGASVALFLVFEFAHKPSSLWFLLTLVGLATIWAGSVTWSKSVVLALAGAPDGMEIEEIRKGKHGTRVFPHGTFSAPEIFENKTAGGFGLRIRCGEETLELATALDRKCAEATRKAILDWARDPAT